MDQGPGKRCFAGTEVTLQPDDQWPGQVTRKFIRETDKGLLIGKNHFTRGCGQTLPAHKPAEPQTADRAFGDITGDQRHLTQPGCGEVTGLRMCEHTDPGGVKTG